MDDITCGLFIMSEGKLLIIHPTGQSDKFWSIPKGLCDENENNHIITAIREVEEETGLKIDINDGNYLDLGFSKYKKRKKILHAFIFFSNKNLTNQELKCNSMVFSKEGNYSFSEVDKFKWIEPTNENILILHKTQQNLLTNYMSYVKEI